jgi:hypothetical protein
MTTQKKIKSHFPNAQVEERNYGSSMPTRFEKKMRWRRNFFVVCVAPWSYEIGMGRTKDEAWTDALKYVKCLTD